MDKMPSWGIVGGGILGMSLALRLAQKGHSVTLYEAESNIGGLVSPYEGHKIIWDKYYHVILQSDTLTLGLLQDLELDKNIRWKKAKSGFYADGHFYSMSNIWEFLRFPLLNLWSKIRLGVTILFASKIKNPHKLNQQSLEKWLIRWSGKAAFDKIWLPLLRAKLGESYKETSASFIQATISRMYSARNQGQKEEKFGYVVGGYLTILRELTEHLKVAGVKIKTSYPVKKVEGTPENQILLSGFDGKQETFDRIILTVPSPLVPPLCPDLSEEDQARLKQTPFLGIVCGSLLVKKPLEGFYITNITDNRVPFTAVIEMTALMNREDFQGYSLVYMPKYVSPFDPLFEVSPEDLKQRFTQAFLQMYPQLKPDDLFCFRAAKNRYVFSPPQQNNGHPATSFKTSIPGIFTVNSAFITNGTLNVNETLALTEKALDEILMETH